ncbi:unnamed protein product, partial [Didymodactylos carnosus]
TRKIPSRQTVLGSDSGSDYNNSRPAPALIAVFDGLAPASTPASGPMFPVRLRL